MLRVGDYLFFGDDNASGNTLRWQYKDNAVDTSNTSGYMTTSGTRALLYHYPSDRLFIGGSAQSGSNRNIMYSTAYPWDTFSNPSTMPITGRVHALATGVVNGIDYIIGGGLVSSGDHTICYSTDNGANFTGLGKVIFPTGCVSLAYGHGGFVGVGSSGAIGYSFTGADWFASTDTLTYSGSRVIYTGSVFLCAGDSTCLYTTNRGINWTSTTFPWSNALTGLDCTYRPSERQPVNPDAVLDMSVSKKMVSFPVLEDSERDALLSKEGSVVYNVTGQRLDYKNKVMWSPVTMWVLIGEASGENVAAVDVKQPADHDDCTTFRVTANFRNATDTNNRALYGRFFDSGTLMTSNSILYMYVQYTGSAASVSSVWVLVDSTMGAETKNATYTDTLLTGFNIASSTEAAADSYSQGNPQGNSYCYLTRGTGRQSSSCFADGIRYYANSGNLDYSYKVYKSNLFPIAPG